MEIIGTFEAFHQLPHLDSWNCDSCNFHNEFALFNCQLCGSGFLNSKTNQTETPIVNVKIQEGLKPVYLKIESEMNKISLCQNCLFADAEQVAKCQNCKDTLDNTRQIKYFEMWICPLCEFKNENKKLTWQHLRQCKKKKVVKPVKIVEKKTKKPKISPPPKAPSVVIKSAQYEFVFEEQNPIQIRTLISLQDYQSDILTFQQKQTLYYLYDNYRKHHNRARQQLLSKIIKIGFLQQDLNLLQDYFENNVQIIVHVHVVKHFEFFVKDTHYRNQFETNKSSGTLCRESRTGWQCRMFNKKYDEASNFDRVKYGVVNITNDKKGVASCKGYGNSHFVLKKEVRNRCTFTEMDSSNAMSTMGSLRYPNHVLLKFTDIQLKSVIEAAKGKQVFSNCISSYKQLQIHGSFKFDRDIQKLYVGSSEVSDPKFLELVKEFSQKFNVPYQIF